MDGSALENHGKIHSSSPLAATPYPKSRLVTGVTSRPAKLMLWMHVQAVVDCAPCYKHGRAQNPQR